MEKKYNGRKEKRMKLEKKDHSNLCEKQKWINVIKNIGEITLNPKHTKYISGKKHIRKMN